MSTFFTLTNGSLTSSSEATENSSWAPEVGYIVAFVLDDQIHYYGAETLAELLVVAQSCGADETVTESNVVAWMGTNVGPVVLDGELV